MEALGAPERDVLPWGGTLRAGGSGVRQKEEPPVPRGGFGVGPTLHLWVGAGAAKRCPGARQVGVMVLEPS